MIYEDRALAFTEAPTNANGLMRQRFRWSFGIMQAVWKHIGAIREARAMGLFALPNIIIFQILLPLVSPFIDLMFVAGRCNYFYRQALPSGVGERRRASTSCWVTSWRSW